MKKSKKQISFLDMGIFPGTVLFSSGFSVNDFYRHLMKMYKTGKWKPEMGENLWLKAIADEREKLTSNNYWALQRVLEHPKYGKKICHYILIFDNFKFTDEEMCKLAHECLHICQFHLPDILDRNKEYEGEAYLHTHLMRQALKIMRE